MTSSVSLPSLPVSLNYPNPNEISKTAETIDPKTGKSKSEPLTCPICMDSLHSGKIYGLFNKFKEIVVHKEDDGIKHPFHAECLLRFIDAQRMHEQTPSCPMCSRKISLLPTDIEKIEKLNDERLEAQVEAQESKRIIKALRGLLVVPILTGLLTTMVFRTLDLGFFGTCLTTGMVAIFALSKKKIPELLDDYHFKRFIILILLPILAIGGPIEPLVYDKLVLLVLSTVCVFTALAIAKHHEELSPMLSMIALSILVGRISGHDGMGFLANGGLESFLRGYPIPPLGRFIRDQPQEVEVRLRETFLKKVELPIGGLSFSEQEVLMILMMIQFVCVTLYFHKGVSNVVKFVKKLGLAFEELRLGVDP